MSKLKVIIKFDSTEKRDKFLIKLLNIDTLLNQAKLKKKERERILEAFNNFIKMIEPPRKGNPYYKLYNTFYYGCVGNIGYDPKPWTQAGVFLNGIRSIYMLYRYKYIKGIWLCIEFRNNKIGREKYYWTLDYIPKEKLGENIPLPDKIRYRKRLARVLEVLNGYNPERYADELFSILLDVKEKMPSAYTKNYIYLWEDLDLLFDSMDRFDKCLECYENLAELMPNSSDPYLNMGVFCTDRGLIKEAIEYYKKGLEINPNDEYIYYNLSSLLLYQGRQDKAFIEINNAILENPERGINFKLKGDIHFSKHQYHQAIQCYEWALNLFDEEWEESARECKELLAEAYLRIGDKEKADEIKKLLNGKTEKKADVVKDLSLGSNSLNNLNNSEKLKMSKEQAIQKVNSIMEKNNPDLEKLKVSPEMKEKLKTYFTNMLTEGWDGIDILLAFGAFISGIKMGATEERAYKEMVDSVDAFL